MRHKNEFDRSFIWHKFSNSKSKWQHSYTMLRFYIVLPTEIQHFMHCTAIYAVGHFYSAEYSATHRAFLLARTYYLLLV